MSDTGLVWYSIFNALHPIVIIGILIWSIQINAQSLERQSGKEKNQDGGHGGSGDKGTELSDYSSFLDEASDASVNEIDEGQADPAD